MEKGTIKEKIEEAKLGSTEAEEILYNHYYKCYYDVVEANRNIEGIELIYSETLKELIKKSIEKGETNIPNYIRNTIFRIIKLYNDNETKRKSKRTEVNNTIISAKTDINARGKLIERYMYLIDSYLINADFGIYLSKEDAKQIGYLFLTEKINNYFDNYENLGKVKLSIYLSHAINSSYMHVLIREKRKNQEFYDENDLCELIKYDGINFEEENMEFEYNDYIDSLKLKPLVKEIFKYLPNNKEKEIVNEQGATRQNVSEKIIIHRKKVKNFFEGE